jgi:hypothetical protein
MIVVTLSACVLGVVSGVRHAVEPDHVAAVSTLIAEGKGPRASMRYAAAWGAGHGVMLVALAAPLAVLGASLPKRAADVFELLVAAVLVALGVRALVVAVRDPHEQASKTTRLAFAVGLVHGLAGSGVLAALVASRMASPVVAIVFIAIYALGAALGMSALAGVLGVPLVRLSRSRGAARVLVGISAALSLVVGALWAAPIVARLAG